MKLQHFLTGIAAALLVAFASAPARSSPVTYTLNPAVMAQFSSTTIEDVSATSVTQTDTITGTFTYDPSNSHNNSADLDVTGPVVPGDYYLQSFTDDGQMLNATTGAGGCSVPGESCLTMTFASPLSPPMSGSTHVTGFTLTNTLNITFTATNVTGAVTPVPAPVPTVPAPAALVLLVVGLFLLSRWGTGQNRHPDPDRQGAA
jgi:hypothetical protein